MAGLHNLLENMVFKRERWMRCLSAAPCRMAENLPSERNRNCGTRNLDDRIQRHLSNRGEQVGQSQKMNMQMNPAIARMFFELQILACFLYENPTKEEEG